MFYLKGLKTDPQASLLNEEFYVNSIFYEFQLFTN
ncbi:hypothetical protein CCP3SC15_220022 [Gammaproteobacteria bacterium]